MLCIVLIGMGQASLVMFVPHPAKQQTVLCCKSTKSITLSPHPQVHHFNPGGNVPAWLMNWLAEGKPMAFVRRLEDVAMKWDERALTTKNMPCKGRGFGESFPRFSLLPGVLLPVLR